MEGLKNKPQDIFELSRETAMSLANGSWPEFLRTAAWNFKYDFVSQVLIYAQKPDATACANYEQWTDRFQRQPRRGTGIALIADNGSELGLRYVFDISDTFVRKGALTPAVPIWEVTEEKERTIREALIQEYLPEEEQTEDLLSAPPAAFYRTIAGSIVREQCEEFVRELWAIQDTCALQNTGRANAEHALRGLLVESVAAILQYRCGHEANIYEPALSNIKDFNSIDAISALGTATQNMARQALLEVARAVQQWDNEHKEEIQHDHNISAVRGAPHPEPEHSAPAEMEQVRTDAQDISERAQAEPVRQLADEGRIEPTSGGDRGESPETGGPDDEPSVRPDTGAPSGGHSGEYSISEQSADAGRGADAAGDHLRINDSDIRRAITAGPAIPGGKFRLYSAIVDDQIDQDSLIDAVIREYGTGNRAFMLSSGLPGTLSWGSEGLKIDREGLREGNSITLPWKTVSDVLRSLVEDDLYLDEQEKTQMQAWSAARNAILERRKAGETMSALLSVLETDRESLSQSMEHVRAYIFENSDTARQALAGKLLELQALESVRASEGTREIFRALSEAFSVYAEDEHTLPSATDAGIPNPFPTEDEPVEEAHVPEQTIKLPASISEVEVGMTLHLPQASYIVAEMSDTQVVLEDVNTPLFSQTMPRAVLDTILRNAHRNSTSKAQQLNTQSEEERTATTSDAEPVKVSDITENLENAPETDYSNNSIHTLRTAISGLLNSQYGAYLVSLPASDLPGTPDEDELSVILEDFVNESSIYAAAQIPEQVERALRTPDYNGSAIAATAFRMRESDVAEISRAGREALLMLRELYQTDEQTILKAANTSGWIDVPKTNEAKEAPAEEQPVRKMNSAERNYAFLESFAPAILDGTLDYIRFESVGFEPLYIERILPDRIAMAHTYTQNGDLCMDPEIVFALDEKHKELLPLSFEQSIPPVYEEIYEEVGIELRGRDRTAERHINEFLTTWFANLGYQGHEPTRGIKHSREGDIEYIFENGRMMPKPEEQPAVEAPAFKFGYKDAILLQTGGYEVHSAENDEVTLLSQETGEVLAPVSAQDLSDLIRKNPDNMYTPGWRRSNVLQVFDREDQRLLCDRMMHIHT